MLSLDGIGFVVLLWNRLYESMTDEMEQKDLQGRPSAAISEVFEPAEAHILSLFKQLSGCEFFFFLLLVNSNIKSNKRLITVT